MTAEGYVILAYVLGLGMLWGYGVWLWIAARALNKEQRDAAEGETCQSS